MAEPPNLRPNWGVVGQGLPSELMQSDALLGNVQEETSAASFQEQKRGGKEGEPALVVGRALRRGGD